MNCYYDTFRTSFGPFSLAVNATGAVVATAFGAADSLRALLRKCHVIRDTLRTPPSNGAHMCHVLRDTSRTAEARRQVVDYLAGKRRNFVLPLAPQGTAFQLKVWRALRRIPRGRTTSYGALAKKLGRPAAARAIGRANATNPITLIIPCHRVIGADGSLTGYAYGEKLKRRLLALEGAM